MTYRNSSFQAVLISFLYFACAGSAEATNGYFSHGYGVKNKALAEAGIALPLEPLAAINPAALPWLGKRYDLAVAVFNPNRQYSVSGNPSGFPGTFGLAPGTVQSGTSVFAINIIAPGVIEQHLTFGFSKKVGGKQEVSFALRHAFSHAVDGPNPLEAPGRQSIELKMNQWRFAFGLSF
jgi:hypothetical protein